MHLLPGVEKLITLFKEKLDWDSWDNWHPRSQTLVKLFPLLLILFAIPFTVNFVGQQQNLSQEAAKRCRGNNLYCGYYKPISTPTPTPVNIIVSPVPTLPPGVSPTPTPATSCSYPTDRNPLAYVAVPSAPSLPGYLSPVTDPTWGTKITRISSAAGFRHDYSRIPAWNSDQTKILLGYTYPGRMLNGTTYAELPWFTNGGNQVAMATWANTNPNILYGVSGNQFISQNATTGLRTPIHTFTGYTNISLGDYEGGIDDTDTYVALIGTLSGGAMHLITYNVKTDTIVADIVAPSGISDAQISRKGNYVTFAASNIIGRYNRTLTSLITLQGGQYSYSHGDNALDANGNEIYVVNQGYNGTSGSDVPVAYNLSTGARTILFPGLDKNNYLTYGHVSGRNINLPGWVYLSNYDETRDGNGGNYPGKDQVVAVKTDGSGTVRVFGFQHHIQQTANPDLRYRNEPQATVSRDGARVIFASNWGNSGSEPYAFVASTPSCF